MMHAITDYLIIGYLMLASGWKVTLPVLAVLSLYLLFRHSFIPAALVIVILIWMILAAWQFETYM
ncbi:hypothetical protein JE971_004148 [Salmonella enterica subsp. enterica serovar Agona]|uniref:hypothetical protein n=1 Tax=Enterobacter chuandaensis TaxID=2497875 RepID=UPI00128A81B2|nr:hypothetical protein [Salmonella enterica subsp. enterica serovar Agona]ECM4294505.1 hypothetical protein [Salmonella enterica subsp. enterica serovar Montevideo]EED3651550.1 hypothetical protein [Salmonella enterica subsp. enterica serovar Agona]EHA0437388.1 hypothetical protein [Salmonella enterica subsp. enterica serovar Agona]